MAEVIIEAAPPIDATKAGVLEVAPEILAHLFNLPQGQRITAAQVEDVTGTILLLVEGDGLPARPSAGIRLDRVQIMVTKETRPASAGGHEYRLTGAWSHTPDVTWEIRPWGPQS